MTATNLDLTIEQGATFSQTINVGTAYNGRTPAGKIVDRFGGTVLATLTCTAVSSGSTTISLTATETAALAIPANADVFLRVAALGFWDLEDDNSGTVTRLRQGKVSLSLEATT